MHAFENAGHDIRSALNCGNEALGDLRVAEHALRAAASEDNPLDDETRQVVLCRSIELIGAGLDALDDALDLLDDRLGDLLDSGERGA